MSAESRLSVPTWVLSGDSHEIEAPITAQLATQGMSVERLGQLRDALAIMADRPLVTLEAYSLPEIKNSFVGKTIPATAPLASGLTNLLQHSSTSIAKAAPAFAKSLETGGETLYRMVVPSATAARMGTGVVKSMPSAAVQGAIHGSLLGAKGIVGQASFVPVAAEVASGTAVVAAGTAAVTGTVAVATVAAPLVLIALATAATVYAEEQRRRALQRIQSAVDDLKQRAIHDEFDALNASSRALDTATALLLDEGRIGHSVGLDSAVHAIDKAVESAQRNANDWLRSLTQLTDRGATASSLKKSFPDIQNPDGEFRARLRMAAFAIAMKRRLVVLQAVEHAQMSPGNSLERFMDYLDGENERLSAIEEQVRDFLHDLSRIDMRPEKGWSNKVITRGEARDLLAWPRNLRILEERETPADRTAAEMELILARNASGALTLVTNEIAG